VSVRSFARLSLFLLFSFQMYGELEFLMLLLLREGWARRLRQEERQLALVFGS